jgi:glutamine synthetase
MCDAAGIRRARAVPVPVAAASATAAASSLQALLRQGVGLTVGIMGMPAHADMVAPESGLTPVGEVRLVPGRASKPPAPAEEAPKKGAAAKPPPPPAPPAVVALVRPIPWGPPGHAFALADMLDADSATEQPWACCPRAALRRVASAARRELGVAFTVGFELEFCLLAQTAAPRRVPAGPVPSVLPPPDDAAWRAADDLPYASSLGLDAHAELLGEIVASCAALGQPVVQYHGESAPGQYELALAAHGADPVAAADGVLLAKEAVAALAARRGFLAVFAPKPYAGAAGTGMHAHVSVVDARDGRNLMAGGGGREEAGDGPPGQTGGVLSPLGERFVAGLLSHLPALLPFTAPSAGSYERLRPGCWAGAFATYGVENREAPLRITAGRGATAAAGGGGGGGGSSSSSSGRGAAPPRPQVNVEVKAVDATANPYTALAALLTAGMMGMRDEAARLPGPPLGRDPGAAAPAPGAAAGPSPAPLPASLPEALAALEADAALAAALRDPASSLGAPLFSALVGVRKCEARLGVTAAQTALRY